MRFLIIALGLLLASGCATVTRGTSEVLVIETTPANAAVRLDQNGELINCESPCSVKVKRRGNLFIRIEKDGYELFETNVTSSIDGGGAAGMAGNVVLGGIIGAGVDAGTGAMHSHKPNPLTVALTPLADASTGRKTATDASDSEADPFDLVIGRDSEDVSEAAEGDSVDPLDITQD